MKNPKSLIEKYSGNGVTIDNIQFAIDAVKYGAKRDNILEDLTADYRGMRHDEATAMLEDIYVLNGGEFKKENRTGYLYGTLFLMIGGTAAFYILYAFINGGVVVRPVLVFAAAIGGLLTSLVLFIKAIKGKYRDADDPFDS